MAQSEFEAQLDDFVGSWTVNMLEGFAWAQGMDIVLPMPRENDVLTTSVSNGALFGQNKVTPGLYEMNFAAGVGWFEYADQNIALSALDGLNPIEFVPFTILTFGWLARVSDVACDPEEMLQLVARGAVRDPQFGGNIDFFTRFYFVTKDHGLGLTVATVPTPRGPLVVRRSFGFVRQ